MKNFHIGSVLTNRQVMQSTSNQGLGWCCETVELSVLAANHRAIRCYEKAGFTFKYESEATWGPKQFAGSRWQRFGKVHKHHVKQGSPLV